MPSTRRPVSQRPAGRMPAGSTRARPPSTRPSAPSRPPAEPHGATAVTGAASRPPLTGRAAVLAVVLVVLVLSFAYPLRAWFDQRAQISELNERTVAQERKVADLQAALARWDDPAYVQAVARERLRFVLPGEASFVVLGDDVVGAGSEPADDLPGGEWWQRLWATVEEADLPPEDGTAAGGGASAPETPTVDDTVSPTPIATASGAAADDAG